MIVVKTDRGYVTSYREAWPHPHNPKRTVWTWRTDRGKQPLDFGTIEEATDWVNEVWCCASTARELADKASWLIQDVTPSPDEAGLIRV